MAESTIPKVVKVYTGTNASSLNVPSGTVVNICSVSLPSAGVYVITGGFQYSTGFNNLCGGLLKAGTSTIVGTQTRFSGDGGGGYNSAIVYEASEPVTINLAAFQNSSSTKTASNIALKAVRVG